ncbi:MAG: O-antigen ligase family protein, partial [Patescibacteria group bacterium]
HYYIFFILLLVLLKDREDWKWAMRLSLVAAALLILYGVFAQLGWDNRLISPYRTESPPTTWGKITSARFQGSLGNPSYVAPYLLFSLFYVLYLWFHRDLKPKAFVAAGSILLSLSIIATYLFTTITTTPGSFPPSSIFLLVLGLLSLIGSLVYSFYKKEYFSLLYGFLTWVFSFFLILSQTRGAIMALVVGAAVFLVHLVFFLPKAWKKGSFAVLVVLLLTTGSLYYYRHSTFVQNLPGSRVLDLFDQGTKTDSVQTRLWTWGSAWKGFKERPIFGWGQENFSLVFDKHFDPRHYKPGQVSETWFDRAHSVIFDYLSETGILGLLSYLGMFVVLFWRIIKNWNHGFVSRDDQGASRFQSIFLRGLFIITPMAYLIQGLALFDVLPIFINLFFFLALSSYHLDIKNEHHT